MTVAVRRLFRVLAATVLAAAWVVGLHGITGPIAQAHSQLLRSTPAEGSTVTSPLTSVALVFNEDITALNAQVLLKDSAGSLHQQPAQVNGPTVTVPVIADVARGFVQILYRVTSKDGHPITGTVTFQYAAPKASTPAAATSPASTSPTAQPTPSAEVSTASAAASGANGTSGASGDPIASASNPGSLYGIVGAIAVALVVVGGLVLRHATAPAKDR